MQISQKIYSQLKSELEKLREVSLPRASAEYQVSIDDGDGLHDNPHQQNSKAEIERINEKISDLERILEISEVIDDSSNIINLGSTVKLIQNDREVRTVTLVDRELLTYVDNAITADSPLGSQLIGKKSGDIVKVTTPGGEAIYVLEIIS